MRSKRKNLYIYASHSVFFLSCPSTVSPMSTTLPIYYFSNYRRCPFKFSSNGISRANSSYRSLASIFDLQQPSRWGRLSQPATAPWGSICIEHCSACLPHSFASSCFPFQVHYSPEGRCSSNQVAASGTISSPHWTASSSSGLPFDASSSSYILPSLLSNRPHQPPQPSGVKYSSTTCCHDGAKSSTPVCSLVGADDSRARGSWFGECSSQRDAVEAGWPEAVKAVCVDGKAAWSPCRARWTATPLEFSRSSMISLISLISLITLISLIEEYLLTFSPTGSCSSSAQQSSCWGTADDRVRNYSFEFNERLF